LQPGLAPQSLHDTRLGQTLDALFDANLGEVFSAIAWRALETYPVETPWIHQDTTTMSFYGADEDRQVEDTGPRPTYGYSQEGRDDLKQVILSLGVSGDGGLPLRMGLHDGHHSDSVDVPEAMEQRVGYNLGGLHGMVADSKAYTQRTLGLCLETGMGLVTLVPRTCAIPQEVEPWGQQPVSLPLLLDKPGKRLSDAPRRGYGRSVTRPVEVEDREGHLSRAPIRFIAVYSTPLAQRHAEAHEPKQKQEAQALATPITQVKRRQFACHADAQEAIAAYEGRRTGQRGRSVTPWRNHEVRYEVASRCQRQKRTQRGRPRKDEGPQEELVYHLNVTSQVLAAPVASVGWLVLATTIKESTCSDAEVVTAYRDQTTTVERGFRWLNNPAAIHPVWLEKRERIAALAMLRVVGLLVYGLIQRQVRQYLLEHHEKIPANKGETDSPTATVVFEAFATLTRVELSMGSVREEQFHGWRAHHERVFRALGLSPLIDDTQETQKHDLAMPKGP
jgi:transposase